MRAAPLARDPGDFRAARGARRSGVTGSNRSAAGGPDPRWSGRENECGGCRRRLQEADAGGGGGGGGKEAR